MLCSSRHEMIGEEGNPSFGWNWCKLSDRVFYLVHNKNMFPITNITITECGEWDRVRLGPGQMLAIVWKIFTLRWYLTIRIFILCISLVRITAAVLQCCCTQLLIYSIVCSTTPCPGFIADYNQCQCRQMNRIKKLPIVLGVIHGWS